MRCINLLKKILKQKFIYIYYKMEFNKYNNGKIYKIVCNTTGLIYIGSTTKKLEIRLSQHKSDYKRHLDGKYRYVSSFEIIKNEDYYIHIIEEFNCNNKNELLNKEKYYINITKCVNKVKPLRTQQEIKQYQKNYNDNNKDKKKEFYKINKEKMKQYQKEYRNKNK